jgi:RNA polymerase sigma factor (TIGR02999 family)
MQSSVARITTLLQNWGEGDRQALDQLIPMVYDGLRELAHRRLRAEHRVHSLNTTALVHEAYLRLVDVPRSGVRDRAHFLALASRVMRHLLIDQARARDATKRGAGVAPLELDEALDVPAEQLDAVAELHEALERLERLDPRQSSILEQRYFGGLSLEESAEALGVSLATVKRELRSARAWLAIELGHDPVT